jgi:hypothetical protein
MKMLDNVDEDVPNGWDEHFCFNIVDFTPGTEIIVNKSGKKERGIVVNSDQNMITILYKNARNELNTVGINSVVFLQDGTRNWLSKPI